MNIKRLVIRLFNIKPLDVMHPYVPSGHDDDTFHINVAQCRQHHTALDGKTCTFCGSSTDQCMCW